MTPTLNFVVLTDALHALKEGNIRHCEALGFTYDELNAINALSLDELFVLSRASAQFMNVTVNHENLRQILAQARQELLLQSRIHRAIQLGGSIELLNNFFGLSSGEISARRRLQGISLPQGRTQIPDEDIDARIWRRWEQLRPANLYSMDALDAMLRITEEMQSPEHPGSHPDELTLTVVWNRIMQCEKEKEESCHD